MTLRAAGIITGPDTYLDHLAPVCHIMQIPLIVTEESVFRIATEFYPNVSVLHKDLTELSGEYLASSFDALFESGKFWSIELAPIFSLFYGKTIRFVFCPHGNSDKGHSIRTPVKQDIALFYGEHMQELLIETGAADRIGTLIRSGNYRLPFYRSERTFYDRLAEEKIQSRFCSDKPIVLYAPTWQDGENPSSFFMHTRSLLEELSKEYRIIVKLHPFLEEFHPAHTYHVISTYENDPNVLFLTDFPAIYPLLQMCDLYIGDYSSIGYDFLAFDKPLYFLEGETPSRSAVRVAGLTIPRGKNIRSFVAETISYNREEKRSLRKEIYSRAFGEEKDPEELRVEILRALQSERSI